MSPRCDRGIVKLLSGNEPGPEPDIYDHPPLIYGLVNKICQNALESDDICIAVSRGDLGTAWKTSPTPETASFTDL